MLADTNPVATAVRSSIGKTIVMATTGAVLSLRGRLQARTLEIFIGREHFDRVRAAKR